MIGIGKQFPRFSLTGVVSNDIKTAFQPFTNDSAPGKWQVVFFWPLEFVRVGKPCGLSNLSSCRMVHAALCE